MALTPDPAFDPSAFKEATHAQWQEAAAAWYRWTPTLQRWLDPVTRLMLDMAQLQPGERVLDIAAGAGEPSVSAAIRVGSTGYVLATDLSSNILAYADQSARARGLGAKVFETRVMDGENLDLADASFDVVLSRLGLIYFPDRRRGLSEMYRVLKPGGRAVIAGFTTPAANGFFAQPLAIIRRRANLPPPGAGQPGPFSLGDPAVLEAAYRQAGFAMIESTTISPPLHLSSAAECTRFERESFGALGHMLASMEEKDRAAVWVEVEQALRQYEGPDGFAAPTEVRVGLGVKTDA